MKYMFNIYFYYINGFSYRISSSFTMTTYSIHYNCIHRMLNASMAIATTSKEEDTPGQSTLVPKYKH